MTPISATAVGERRSLAKAPEPEFADVAEEAEEAASTPSERGSAKTRPPPRPSPHAQVGGGHAEASASGTGSEAAQRAREADDPV